MPKDILTEITRSLVECEAPDLAAELSQEALEQGEEPLTIINQGLEAGMEVDDGPDRHGFGQRAGH